MNFSEELSLRSLLFRVPSANRLLPVPVNYIPTERSHMAPSYSKSVYLR